MSEYVPAGSAVIEASSAQWLRDKLYEAQARIARLDEEARGPSSLASQFPNLIPGTHQPNCRINQRRLLPDRRNPPGRRSYTERRQS